MIDRNYELPQSYDVEGVLSTNLNALLKVASDNKLLFPVAQWISDKKPHLASKEVTLILDHSANKHKSATRTLSFLTDVLGGSSIEFMIIKTFKGMDYVTLDIDVLLKGDFASASEVFEANGAIQTDGRFLEMVKRLRVAMPGFAKDGLLKMDIYTDIPWWLPVVGSSFMWRDPKRIKMFGAYSMIPDPKADLVSNIAASLFTDRKMALLDFIYVNDLIEKINDWGPIESETMNKGWNTQFFEIIDLFGNMKKDIYRQATNSYSFPYEFPTSLLINCLFPTVRAKLRRSPKSTGITLWNVIYHSFLSGVYTKIFNNN